jgi:hypothetical protein
MSIVYREKLGEHQASVHQNATGLLNVIGAAKSLTTGYAGWMAKSLVAATGAGTVFGLAGFMLGLTPLFGYQPCLGFMVRGLLLLDLWASDAVRHVTCWLDHLNAHTRLALQLGAELGFTGGLITRWVADKGEAKRACMEFPSLMKVKYCQSLASQRYPTACCVMI